MTQRWFDVFVLLMSFVLLGSRCLAQDWTVNGPYGGTVTAILVHPQDTSVVYAGTDAAGIYRSLDAGAHWVPMNQGFPVQYPYTQDSNPDSLVLLQDYYPVTVLRCSSSMPDTLFAGTSGAGVVRSDDGGVTWHGINIGLPDSVQVEDLQLMRDNPQHVWCATATPFGGVYFSTNSGETWDLIEALPHEASYTWTALTFDRRHSDTLYAGFNSAGEADTSWGLFRSADGGVTWQLVSEAYSFYDMVVNPDDPTDLWSVVYTGYQEWQLAHSSDAGATWSIYPADTPWTWVSGLRQVSNDTLYVQTGIGPYTLWRSPDFGQTWDTVTSTLPLGYLGYHDLTSVSSAPSTLYFATNGGVYWSRNGGVTGQEVSNGILNTHIHALVVHPTQPQTLYAGGEYGFWKSVDAGQSWQRLGVYNINEVAVDVQHPDTLYFGGDSLVRTTNGGDTFDSIYHNLTGVITAMSLLQDSTNQIIVGTIYYQYRFLFRTNNSGAHWEMVKLFYNGFLLQALVQPPLLPFYLVLGTDAYTYTPMMRSTDRGRTWDETWNRDVGMTTAIATVPTAEESLYVATRNQGVRVSGDNGRTFRTINLGMPEVEFLSVFLDWQENAHLLAGSRYHGLFSSSYPEGAWHSVAGSYYPRITKAVYQHTPARIIAATAGRGVWIGEHIPLVVEPEHDKPSLPQQLVLHPPYPNPFNASTVMRFQLPRRQDTRVTIYDLQGKAIRTLLQRSLAAGDHIITWNGRNNQGHSVASGMYLIQVQTEQQIGVIRKVLYLK